MYSGAGCESSSSDLTTGALEGNSSSESSSSNSSSRLTLGFTSAAGLGASSMATSWVSGSGLITSGVVLDDSSAAVDSGDVECGIFAVPSFVSVLFDMGSSMLKMSMLGNATRASAPAISRKLAVGPTNQLQVLLPSCTPASCHRKPKHLLLSHYKSREGMNSADQSFQYGGGGSSFWRGVDLG
jgi:hypothetical protein